MQTSFSFRNWMTATCSGLILGVLLLSGSPLNAADPAKGLPRMLDIGSHSCIPCKLMAPILEDMKRDYAGKLIVDFMDTELPENAQAAKNYKVEVIPTQIFFDADGKELWRHSGFISQANLLAKWKELGYSFIAESPVIERWAPLQADTRAKTDICYMCESTIAAKTRVTVSTEKGDVNLCSPHCYFIMLSSLTENTDGIEKRVMVTDWSTGKKVQSTEATYLHSLDAKTGKPTTKAFASQKSGQDELQKTGGSLVNWSVLQTKELALRCGFCDRACHQEDAAAVRCGGIYTWGCCSHCALGVAARSGKDIEIRERDRLTGEPITVRIADGQIASIEPKGAIAWFGQKKNSEGKFVSAGCFHQGFFTAPDHLRTWLEKNPAETGKIISIDQALADKMAMTPAQISKACKIGECAPK